MDGIGREAQASAGPHAAMIEAAHSSSRSSPRLWPSWALGLGLLTVAVSATLAPRLGRLTLRGEETRRARVAWEMVHRGEWIVPRLQGEAYTSRPPLANWLIALAAEARGEFDLFAARAPSLVATWLATLLVYSYSRAFVSPGSALVAGLAYLSSWNVLELGRLAETEAVLALLTGASLLVWHFGYARGWPPAAVWILGYSLAALAALTKGLQPVVYFVGTTAAFLALRRDWAALFSRQHALGVAAFAALVGGWWLPYTARQGLAGGLEIWFRNVQIRYEAPSGWAAAVHFLTYPIEALFNLLPWSALSLAFLRAEVRRGWEAWASPLRFLALALGLALASCWLAAEARSRYLMPVAPCAAALVGLIVERVRRAGPVSDLRKAWRDFLQGYALAIAVVAAVLLVASAGGWLVRLPLHQSWLPSLVIASATFGLAIALARLGAGASSWTPVLASVLVALSVVGAYDVVWMNWLLRRAETTGRRVAELRAALPRDARLVSFGPLHHAFLFHSQTEIPQLAWPEREISVPDDVEYFCFHETRTPREPLPFAWEKVAEISCDRHRRENPFDRVLVGRRTTTRVAREAVGRRR